LRELNEEEINSVRSKADISEIIGHYLPLVKKGKSHSAVCPFHDDHDPSLSISQDKQIYKCFVCGAGGNVFTFVRDYEHISFREAVVKVAQWTGVELSSDFHQDSEIKIDPKIRRLYDVLRDTVQFTHYALNSSAGVDAKLYLTNRGITDAIIDKFEIGYNQDNDEVTKFMQAKGYTVEELVKANVTRINEYGEKDVFASRITFPIHDPQWKPVGFSARTLIKDVTSKYINTNESPIYTKGKLLYNYHRAKVPARTEKEVFLVEGVTDVLAFDKAGIYNVLATLGTACTKEQIRLIQQASEHVVLCYDGDAAGQNATYKIGQLLNQNRLKIEVVRNDTGMDPDEICQKQSPEALVKISKQRYSWIDFVIDYNLRRIDLENYTQKKEFAKQMMEEISAAGDAFDQETLYQRIQNITQFTPQQLQLLKGNRRTEVKEPTTVRISASPRINRRKWAEYEILGQMLNSLQAAVHFRDKLGFLPDNLSNRCALTILDYYRHHDEITLADFINTVEDESLLKLITELSQKEIYYKDYNPTALADAMAQVKLQLIDEQILKVKADCKISTDVEDRKIMAAELDRLREEKNRIKNQPKEA